MPVTAKEPFSIGRWGEWVFYGLAVFLSAWACVALMAVTGRTAALWLANAVIVVAALKYPRRHTALVIAIGLTAMWAGDVMAGDPPLGAAVLCLCNLAEITLVVFALHRYGDDFRTPRTVFLFYGLVLGPAPLLSGLLAYWYVGDSWGPLTTMLRFWYLGDALSMATLVPPLAVVRWSEFAAMFRSGHRRGTVLALTAMALTIAVNATMPQVPLAFLLFPGVLILTFARGFAGGVVGILGADLYLLALPVLLGRNHDGLAGLPLRDQLTVLLAFAAVLSFTVILAGAALEHRRRLEREMAVALVRAEEARQEALEARDAAEAANRSKSMFLANMSHELRTPLNAVIGFSEIMREEMFGPLGDHRYRDYTRLVHDAGSHLLDVINDILDMSKIEAGKFEIDRRRLDAHEVLQDCLSLMQERARAGEVQLVASVERGPIWLEADRRALKQILLNLLSNAVKFTPPGGSVTAAIACDAADRACIFRIADTGVGIPQDAIARLGRPFVQLRSGAHTTHQGTGLGLALVRALAELHNGKFEIDSAVGVGTTVTVVLPRGDVEPAGVRPELPLPLPERRLSGQKS